MNLPESTIEQLREERGKPTMVMIQLDHLDALLAEVTRIKDENTELRRRVERFELERNEKPQVQL